MVVGLLLAEMILPVVSCEVKSIMKAHGKDAARINVLTVNGIE